MECFEHAFRAIWPLTDTLDVFWASLASHEFWTKTFGLKFILHAPTAKIDGIKRKVSYLPKDDFRPASPKSAALGTPLYLYYSLLFSYSFHSFLSPEREERKEYIREYIRGGYRGVARAGVKDSCDIFLTWVEMVCTCMIGVCGVL